MAVGDFRFIDATQVDGNLLADILNSDNVALLTSHESGVRPTYAQRGMLWLDNSAGDANVLLYVYTGSVDVLLATIDMLGGSVAVNSEVVKVSATDTTANYLLSKLVSSTNIQVDRLNPAGDEQLQFNLIGTVPLADDANKLGGVLPAGYEPSFTKNTAFNKDFGAVNGQVSQGDHNHDAAYEPVIGTKGTAFNKNFGLAAVDVAQGNHSHASSSVLVATSPEVTYTTSGLWLNWSHGLTINSVVHIGTFAKCLVADGGYQATDVVALYNGLTYTDSSNNASNYGAAVSIDLINGTILGTTSFQGIPAAGQCYAPQKGSGATFIIQPDSKWAFYIQLLYL